MSLSYEHLDVVNVLEPRIALNQKREYAILKGGQTSTWKTITSTSFSNSSIQWTAPPPSPGIIVDRYVLAKIPLDITFTGNTGSPLNPLLQLGQNDALRAFPFSSIVQTLAVTINNTQVSINMNDVVLDLLRYNTPLAERQLDYSMTPSMLDQYQNYSDYLPGGGPASESGSYRNPLHGWGEGEESRGGFPIEVVSNTQTEAHIRVTVTEPLFLSPFLFGRSCESSGFIGVQTLDVNATLSGNLARVWSHASIGNPITSVNVSIGNDTDGAPSLSFNYITPQSMMHIPRAVSYPYFVVDRYPTEVGSKQPYEAFSVSSNNIQLQSIPRRMYIYARRSNATRTFETSDTFACLKSISINWNNQSGLLSSASEQDLYRMSVENQCYIPWSGWSVANGAVADQQHRRGGHIGSMLCIEFGKDIALSDLECPGIYPKSPKVMRF